MALCAWCGFQGDGRKFRKIGVRPTPDVLEFDRICRDCYDQEDCNRDVDLEICRHIMQTCYGMPDNEINYAVHYIGLAIPAAEAPGTPVAKTEPFK